MTHSPANSHEDIVYSRKIGWMPIVIRENGLLYVQFGGGATANHEPRTFRVPITEEHLKVIQADFERHFLLWSALLPMADAAGTSNPLDDEAAVALLNPILFGSQDEVEALFKEITWYENHLIAHHADTSLLKKGKLFAAMKSLTAESDPKLADEYYANRRRAERGVYLTILDAAVMKYTGQYIHQGGLPSRNPDAVDPELLPQVLEIIATAEQASAGKDFPWDYDTDITRYAERDKKLWHKLKDTVEDALRNAYTNLAQDAVSSVSFLICREAAKRAHLLHKKSPL